MGSASLCVQHNVSVGQAEGCMKERKGEDFMIQEKNGN